MEPLLNKIFSESFPKDALEVIQATAERLSDCVNPEVAGTLIRSLNSQLIGMGLLGRDVQLHSDELIWMTFEISADSGRYEPVFDPKLLRKTSVEGIFTGFDELVGEDGERTLLYRIEMPIDDDALSYRSVTAPVENTAVFMMPVDSDTTESEIEDEMSAKLQILADIDDPEFRAYLESFIESFKREDSNDLSAYFMREVGIIATYMMAHEKIKDSSELRRVICSIIGLVIREDVIYRIDAQELIIEQFEGSRNVIIDDVECEGYIHGIASANDYELLDGVGDKALDWKDGALQPVLVLLDGDRIEHLIPLKNIKRFEITSQPFDSEEKLCISSLKRFRDRYGAELLV